jgi:hypothetical protein
MSGTHGVFQHRSGYFYTILEEDFCEVYKAPGVNEVCRAYITSILEHLTNKLYESTGKETDLWVFMSLPEMARRMRHACSERTIHKELQGMIKDGFIEKRRSVGKATMEYKLNLKRIRKALEALPDGQSCNSATYHLANLQEPSSNSARSTLQNYKNDLANLQPRITIDIPLEETKITEESITLSDESVAPAENVIDFKKATDGRMKAVKIGATHEHAALPPPAHRDGAYSGDMPLSGMVEPPTEKGQVNNARTRHSHLSHDSNGVYASLGTGSEGRLAQTPGAGMPLSSAVNPPVASTDDATSGQAIPVSPSFPDDAQRTTGTGAARASRSRKKADDEPTPKCDTREIQRRINEHRGYALEEKVDKIREATAVKTWCSLHTIEEYGLVMAGAKKDKYWGKQENYYRIGGLTLLKITPEILARQRAPLQMVANGNTAHADVDDDYSDFDVYKGNGKEERAALRALGEEMDKRGELIW